jgi:hypothetical protein
MKSSTVLAVNENVLEAKLATHCLPRAVVVIVVDDDVVSNLYYL